MKVGFVGLGKMGSGMARNLLRAGHKVSAYNRTRDKAEALAHEGAGIANSPADACSDAEAVFTMLSDDQAVAAVVFGDGGLTAGLGPGAVHISSSTIGVAFAKKLADEHKQRKQAFVSAAVFGRPEAAENKKLIVVAAGENSILERCAPLFDAIGRRTFHAGAEPWQANTLKLCGNFMIASMIETFSEAFATIRKSGVNHHLFLEVMNELFGSPVYKNYGQIIADEKFDPPGFGLKLGLKDVRQAMEAATDVGVAMPFASVIRDHLVSAIAQGQENLDWSSVARVVARSAGLDDSGTLTSSQTA